MIKNCYLRLIVYMATILFIWFVAICNADAADLPVYNVANGHLVPATVATATADQEGQGALNYNINVRANIPNTLSVTVSATRVEWTIYQKGDYMAKVANFNINSAVNGAIKMTVTGADNIKNGAKALDTYYALRPSNQAGVPVAGNFTAALSFNIAHDINNLQTSIWNRVKADAGDDPGIYTDAFTVTFSQEL